MAERGRKLTGPHSRPKYAFYHTREFHVFREIVGLLEVGLGAQTFRGGTIALGDGRCDNDYRRRAESSAAQFSENFDAGNFRHVQIQEYEYRLWTGRILAEFLQIEHGLLPIAGDPHVFSEPTFLEYPVDDKNVGAVVFDE
jgi:hypothetical protein